MNDTNYQEAVKMAAKPKFKGRKKIVSRAVPRYPDSADRELARISRGYVRILNRTLKENLPEIMEAYKNTEREDSRYDSIFDFRDKLREMIFKMAADMENAFEKFGLYEEVERISRIVHRNSIREWKRAVRMAIGLDIFEDYYKGETYEQLIQLWIADSVNRIKSIPSETLGRMQEILLDGYREGRLIRDIRKEIQDSYNVSKHHAEMLARDQISSLNSEITQMQQRDAGVTRYKWSSSKDSRVRECHQEFDGNIFSWDDPPEAWYSTKSRGIVYTGRRCHPGEDYCCRCCAIPVFEWDTLNLPVTGKGGKE